jgi:hypothetical protein
LYEKRSTHNTKGEREEGMHTQIFIGQYHCGSPCWHADKSGTQPSVEACPTIIPNQVCNNLSCRASSFMSHHLTIKTTKLSEMKCVCVCTNRRLKPNKIEAPFKLGLQENPH